MARWAFRLMLFYICILFIQPQNRFLFLYPLHIADISVIGGFVLHVLSATQSGRPIIRFGPATIIAFLLMVFSLISLYTGAFQLSSAWNSHIDILFKSVIVMVMIEAMVDTVPRAWMVQAAVFLATLWWIKGGVRLIAAGSTFSGERIMGPAVGLVENPNGFAYMLCVMLPLYFYFFEQAKKRWEQAATLALIICAVYIILNTGSRTGLVTMGVMLLFITPRYGRRHKTMLTVSAVAMVILVPTIGGMNMQRFKSIPESVGSFLSGETKVTDDLNQDQQSAQERSLKNRDTFALIREYPLFGVGMAPDEAQIETQWPFATGQVHCEILMAGKQMGIFGMGLYLSLLITLFTSGRYIQRQAASWPQVADLGWTFKVQAVAILVGGAFSPIPWNAVTFILVGSASALSLVVSRLPMPASAPTAAHAAADGVLPGGELQT